jgi:diguanylate cyclase (GGDEF)-like protein
MSAVVLVVEDQLIVADHIRYVLMDLGYEVLALAATGDEALHAADLRLPDLVLMDIQLRGPLDGVETATRLIEKHDVPVVYLTSYSDDAMLARAKRTGPYGYIIKPFTDRELRTSIEVALNRHELAAKAAEKAGRLAAVNLELVARCEERKSESERLLVAARTDPLTEASNRLHLHVELRAVADRANRYGHQACSAFCDIDFFKSYNDSFGHLAGDECIRFVSREIRGLLRESDGFYRYGGDEFLILLPEQSLVSAWDCMERVRSRIASIPVASGGRGLARSVTMSVGVADFRITRDEDSIQSWLKRADAALYRAKARGRNCVEMSGRTVSPLPSRAPTPWPGRSTPVS